MLNKPTYGFKSLQLCSQYRSLMECCLSDKTQYFPTGYSYTTVSNIL